LVGHFSYSTLICKGFISLISVKWEWTTGRWHRQRCERYLTRNVDILQL